MSEVFNDEINSLVNYDETNSKFRIIIKGQDLQIPASNLFDVAFATTKVSEKVREKNISGNFNFMFMRLKGKVTYGPKEEELSVRVDSHMDYRDGKYIKPFAFKYDDINGNVKRPISLFNDRFSLIAGLAMVIALEDTEYWLEAISMDAEKYITNHSFKVTTHNEAKELVKNVLSEGNSIEDNFKESFLYLWFHLPEKITHYDELMKQLTLDLVPMFDGEQSIFKK